MKNSIKLFTSFIALFLVINTFGQALKINSYGKVGINTEPNTYTELSILGETKFLAPSRTYGTDVQLYFYYNEYPIFEPMTDFEGGLGYYKRWGAVKASYIWGNTITESDSSIKENIQSIKEASQIFTGDFPKTINFADTDQEPIVGDCNTPLHLSAKSNLEAECHVKQNGELKLSAPIVVLKPGFEVAKGANFQAGNHQMQNATFQKSYQ